MSEWGRSSWEERWSRALREHGDRVAQRPPNAHLTAEVGDLPPGRALDAGCGHGSEALWLAVRGWRVTAVDFAATALALAGSTAGAMGPAVAGRVDWVEADLATWTPERNAYDLVLCLYLHIAGSVEELVERMAGGVARGGTVHGRPPAHRPGHRGSDGCRRAGAGLGRRCTRRSRLRPVGAGRRGRPSASAGRHWGRCRDPRDTPLLTARAASSRSDD
jgi:SAM-dependent methyltransferase